MSDTPYTLNPQLTRIALAVKNQRFIADEICPRVGVENEQFKYRKWNIPEGFTIPDTRIGRTGQANEVEFTGTLVSDSTEDHGLEDPVPVKDVDNARGQHVDPMAIAAERTANLVELAREQRVATLLTTLANYASTLRATLSGTSQWSHASSTPVTAIMDAADLMLMRPNVLWFSRASWTAFRRHAQVVAAVLGANGTGAASAAAGIVSRQAVADLFEVDKVLVGEAWYNSAAKGQTASYSRLWGKTAGLVYLDPNILSPSDPMPNFCATAEFGSRSAGTYFDPKRGVRGTNVVKVTEQVKEFISLQEAGYFWADAVA